MATISLHHHWVCKFTNEFLEEFYGTTAYFNFETIALEAKPKILARMQKYYSEFFSWWEDELLSPTERSETVQTLRKELAIVKSQGHGYEHDFEFEWTQLEYEFIQDLFEVTSRPMTFAYKLCKGETPNGDCFDGETTAMNTKYNCILIEYVLDSLLKLRH